MKNLFRQTFSLSYTCRSSKADRMGKSPVELVININGERVYVQLPRKENADDFKKMYTSKRGNELKVYLNSVYSEVNAKASEMQVMGLPLTASSLKDYWRNGFKVYSLQDLFDEYIGILGKRTGTDLTLAAYEKYVLASKFFINVIGDKALSEVVNADILKFEGELKKVYKRSTVSGYMSKVKGFFNYALRNRKIAVNPFEGVKISKACEEVIIMSESDYVNIRDKVISIERLEKVRDAFIFGCNCGLSYCDIIDLKKEDFKFIDGRYVINKRRKKTGVEFYSIVLDDGIEIAKKYDFDFSSIMLSNQKTNSYLKEIMDICGVSSVNSLHWHLSRHYYITSLIRLGIPSNIVMKCSGHTNTRMVSRYTHLIDRDIVKIVNNHL